MHWLRNKGSGNHPSGSELERCFTPQGVCVTANPPLTQPWWDEPSGIRPVDRDLAEYIGQLLDEGLAQKQQVKGIMGIVVLWDQIYALMYDQAHQNSVPLLKLPEVGNWVPCLETCGTPSEDFRVYVTAWYGPTHGRDQLQSTGAVLHKGDQTWLMSQKSWHVVKQINKFSRRDSSADKEQIYRSVGQIQQAARACGAMLNSVVTR